LDSEANAITHAMIEARAIVQEMVAEATRLLADPTPDRRAWSDVGLRLMRQRAALVQAVMPLALSQPPPERHSSDPSADVPVPTPPLPRSADVESGAFTASAAIAIPTPPRPRHQ
jgi:hypothetical protein